MKIFQSLVALAVSLLGFYLHADDKPTAVYLLIGQSNMAGRAELGEEDKEPINGVFLLNDKGEWEAATNPLNRYSTVRKDIKMQRMGPGYGFATAMRFLRPEETIGLVVNAKGGSSVMEWQPDQLFFKEAVKRTKVALETPGAELKGIVWHQGETDAAMEGYLEKLKIVVDTLRKELGAEGVPFVAGQICENEEKPAYKGFNERLPEISDVIEKSDYVVAADLSVFDGVHFDPASQRLLGLRYAERMTAMRRKLEGR